MLVPGREDNFFPTRIIIIIKKETTTTLGSWLPRHAKLNKRRMHAKKRRIGKIGGYTHLFSRQSFFFKFLFGKLLVRYSHPEFSLIGRHPNLKWVVIISICWSGANHLNVCRKKLKIKKTFFDIRKNQSPLGGGGFVQFISPP